MGEAQPDGSHGGGGRLVALVVGLSTVLAVQTKAKADVTRAFQRETSANAALAAANAELTRSKVAVQARYDLAVDAIQAFHTGVSEDFMMKQDRFKDLRDQLLKTASDFSGKLGALLREERTCRRGGHSYPPTSRWPSWQAGSAGRRTRWQCTALCWPAAKRPRERQG